MKQFYFLSAAIIFSIAAYTQKEGNAQLYAYRQSVLPGTVRVDENGREVPRKPQYNYYIYLVSSAKIFPVEAWIDGKAYHVNAAMSSTPVEYKNPTSGENKPKVLVPKTTKKVWQLHLASEKINQIKNAMQKNVSDKNQLVIIYKCGKTLYYKSVLKFLELEPLAMQ